MKWCQLVPVPLHPRTSEGIIRRAKQTSGTEGNVFINFFLLLWKNFRNYRKYHIESKEKSNELKYVRYSNDYVVRKSHFFGIDLGNLDLNLFFCRDPGIVEDPRQSNSVARDRTSARSRVAGHLWRLPYSSTTYATKITFDHVICARVNLKNPWKARLLQGYRGLKWSLKLASSWQTHDHPEGKRPRDFHSKWTSAPYSSRSFSSTYLVIAIDRASRLQTS